MIRVLRDLGLRAEQPTPGGVALVSVAVANVVLWVAARPAGQPTGRFIGEICGAEAVLLFSCTLVLATLLPPIERAFSGLDRVVVWHRRTATAGAAPADPALGARDLDARPLRDRDRSRSRRRRAARADRAHRVGAGADAAWRHAGRDRYGASRARLRALADGASADRTVRRAAVAHGAIVDPRFARSTLAPASSSSWSAVLGVAAYVYRELLARFVVPIYDYTRGGGPPAERRTTRRGVARPGASTARLRAGQFVVSRVWRRRRLGAAPVLGRERARRPAARGRDQGGRRLHAASSATRSGRATRQRSRGRSAASTTAGAARSRSGSPAASGSRRSSAGSGASTPASTATSPSTTRWRTRARRSTSTRSTRAGKEHPNFVPHLVVTDRDGFLTAEKATAGRHLADVWVYMCGPPPMTKAFSDGFRRLGVPRSRLRWEEFGAR